MVSGMVVQGRRNVIIVAEVARSGAFTVIVSAVSKTQVDPVIALTIWDDHPKEISPDL
jgi:hypothetical protein